MSEPLTLQQWQIQDSQSKRVTSQGIRSSKLLVEESNDSSSLAVALLVKNGDLRCILCIPVSPWQLGRIPTLSFSRIQTTRKPLKEHFGQLLTLETSHFEATRTHSVLLNRKTFVRGGVNRKSISRQNLRFGSRTNGGVWFGDDATGCGSLQALCSCTCRWWDKLTSHAPRFGYHPSGCKTWLMTKKT